MSQEEKKSKVNPQFAKKELERKAAQKKKFTKSGLRKVNFKSWSQSRREARKGKGPWKGVFRDPVKLSLKGVIMGYRRSRLNLHPNRSLVRIEDVKTRKDARYYLGHRVLYIYRADKKIDPRTGKRELRVISGKITGPHGNNGTVKVNFKPNVPTTAFGKRVRVMLWPHRAPN